MATTLNLPTEGTTFRDTGDVNGDAIYQIKNGQLSTLYSPSYTANTAFSSGGQTYKAGDSLAGNPKDVQWLDPSYRGTATSRTNAYDAYARATGQQASMLPQYNMADIQTALSKGAQLGTVSSFDINTDPNIAGYKNPNAPNPTTGAQQSPAMAAQATQTTQAPAASGTTQAAGAAKPSLTMPANGSVVDLLTMAGQDASFAARQQLAQQFGIANYTGTAQQNTDLAKKYLDAYNAKKGTTPPESGADARSSLGGLTTTNTQNQDPQAKFYDTFAGMNPMESQIFSQISQLMNTQANQQSLVDLYKQEIAAQGLPALNMELADINRIMDGTEDDIRDEITHAGGFATESQVQALAGARNKVLLKKAQYLTDVINAKSDYVDHIVQLTGADRNAVSQQIDQKLGIAKTMFDMTQKLQDNARENYQSIINEIGWSGLAQTVKNNPTQARSIEQAFGLAPGELDALASYKAPLSEKDQLALENQRLQNQKLRADLAKTPANQVDPATKALATSMQQQTISDTDALLNAPGLNSAVGPNFLGRIAIADAFGAKSNFIASVEQLRQQLTLDKLVSAKGSGATFGALSDSELQLLSASASKLGTWAIKDSAGNVTGYSIDESSFKKELDKINNFQKLDYVLKGGSPASVGIQQQSDGSLWVKNSDGNYTRIQ